MCVFTAPDAHSAYMYTEHTSFSYACVHPADKTVEYLTNSYKVLLLILEKKTEAVLNKEGEGEKESHWYKQWESLVEWADLNGRKN